MTVPKRLPDVLPPMEAPPGPRGQAVHRTGDHGVGEPLTAADRMRLREMGVSELRTWARNLLFSEEGREILERIYRNPRHRQWPVVFKALIDRGLPMPKTEVDLTIGIKRIIMPTEAEEAAEVAGYLPPPKEPLDSE